jgi:murein L,D-transpeptidase YcbB/YkuD
MQRNNRIKLLLRIKSFSTIHSEKLPSHSNSNLRMFRPVNLYIVFLFFCCACTFSCKHKSNPAKKDIVVNPAEMNERVQENIASVLAFANQNKNLTADTTLINFIDPVQAYYVEDRMPLWSSREKWTAPTDSLFGFLEQAAYYGLFNSDYQFEKLKQIKNALDKDAVKRTDAMLWANADVAFTNAYFAVLQDLKQGRLQHDSLAWKHDTSKYSNFFTANIERIRNGESFTAVLESVQPKSEGYEALRSGIKSFVDSMDTKSYTYLNFPYKDTAAFIKTLKKRLAESDIVVAVNDSAHLSEAIKKYQIKAGLKADGKQGPELYRKLNNTDKTKFNRLAVTLDRYKQLPENLPEKYIWVNLPGYYLKVWDHDTVALESKIICGKPGTPTPLLASNITDIIIYPTWTVPTSIISKDMLPGLKRNPYYLSRKGMYLLDNNGERVDPAGVNWAKYSKGIPYRIQQGSGDDNALGVIKFNFNNPYSVYLHDTNQRYLFKNAVRSLSHGCVRVQEWEKLAGIIVKNDSIMNKRGDTLRYNTDSITNWVANKERHRIDVKNKFPLFIRYFSCEGINGTIKFYDDMYGDDRALLQKYFAGK